MRWLWGICLGIGAAASLSGKVLEISPGGGLYDEPVRIVASAKAPGGVVQFTTDGSMPTAESRTFSGSLMLSNTTILRTAVFQNGRRVGEVDTRGYIFPAAVLQQKGQSFPGTWGTKDGKPVVADYEMDPEVISAAEYRADAVRSLTALPSLSVVLAPEDLFDSVRGIYAHPEETGDGWERPCAVELIEAGKSSFQVDAGIRIQGGWNRRPEESPKHSFRLVFKKKYGAGKLRYPLFGEGAPKEFDTLILRAGCNNSWLHWSGIERRRGEFIRDQWMRDTVREMGQPSASGLFVHLYLNGLYWGLYNLAERPDAAFAAVQFGGSAADYDAFNASKLLSGSRDAWVALMRRLNQGVTRPEDLAAVSAQLDLQNFTDYMIANLYGANADWDRSSNWYAARRANPPGKFKFFVWDAERTLESPTDDTMDFDDDESPPRIFHRLVENEDFRKYFSERVKLHLLNNGALTPRKAAERYRRWADRIDLAMVAESARWGDYRRDVHRYKEGPYELYTRDTHWRPEVKRLLEEYFPRRTEVLLELFRAKGLYRPN